jgi:hypothetical protein
VTGSRSTTSFFTIFFAHALLPAAKQQCMGKKRAKNKKEKKGTRNEVPNSKFFQKFQYPTKLLVFVSL